MLFILSCLRSNQDAIWTYLKKPPKHLTGIHRGDAIWKSKRCMYEWRYETWSRKITVHGVVSICLIRSLQHARKLWTQLRLLRATSTPPLRSFQNRKKKKGDVDCANYTSTGWAGDLYSGVTVLLFASSAVDDRELSCRILSIPTTGEKQLRRREIYTFYFYWPHALF